jgi:hypothetical protein
VEKEELVHRPGADEVAQEPVERVLDLLLPRHSPHPLTVGEVVELEAPHRPRRMVLDRRAAEVVEHVVEILGGVADLGVRALEEQLEVFLEGENAAVLEEVAAHHRAHLLEEVLRAHGRLLLTRLAGSTPAHIGAPQSRSSTDRRATGAPHGSLAC